jgi:hypothetical protein
MTISAEEVGYWYFRLNGFLTITNFVLHPDEGGTEKSDIDVIGVRFPYRAELLDDPMKDDRTFTDITDKPFVAIVEIKSGGKCRINYNLSDPGKLNIERSLQAIGTFPLENVKEVTDKIHETGGYVSERYHIAFCCLGDSWNDRLAAKYPAIKQILWSDIFLFMYNRFKEYEGPKANHPQWDHAGKILWNAFKESGTKREFDDLVRKLWKISENA